MGTAPDEAAGKLAGAGADFVGTNCCSGMTEAIEIMEDMSKGTPLAKIAQPNAGLPTFESGKAVYHETPQAMAAGLERLLSGGVRIVGGCCGTTPEHIREIGFMLGKCS